MAEVAFVNAYLSALASRPDRITADHVEDPRQYPPRAPYILPKMPKRMSKPKTTVPGQARTIKVSIKSLRNPPIDINLEGQSLKTSLLDLKGAVASETGIPVDKIKLLFKRKPVPDSKVLEDIAAEDEDTVEFSAMIIGGAAAAVANPPVNSEVAQGLSGRQVLETDEFWSDLKGYLLQRVRDEVQAEELVRVFRDAWDTSSGQRR